MSNVDLNKSGFYGAEALMTINTPIAITGRTIYKFASSDLARIPLHVRTGSMSFGSPSERKRFTQVEFHGKGTLWCRIFVDNVFIYEAPVTLTETPSKDRRIGIPTGTRGYVMDVEFAGDANIRVVEFDYRPMGSPS